VNLVRFFFVTSTVEGIGRLEHTVEAFVAEHMAVDIAVVQADYIPRNLLTLL
jgi:hypothetical protein